MCVFFLSKTIYLSKIRYIKLAYMNVPIPFISTCNCDIHLNIDMYSLQVWSEWKTRKKNIHNNLMIIHGWMELKSWEINREYKENSLVWRQEIEWNAMNEMSLCHVMCNMTTLAVDASGNKTARFLDVILQ